MSNLYKPENGEGKSMEIKSYPLFNENTKKTSSANLLKNFNEITILLRIYAIYSIITSHIV